MAVFCTTCGAQNDDFAQNCAQCQSPLPQTAGYQPVQPPTPMYGGPPTQDLQARGASKKIAAGVCGIVLGGLGIHKFILGYTQEGIILLSVYIIAMIIAMVTCGIGTPLVIVPSVIGIIEGIMYLTKSDEEFVRTYIEGRKGWF